MGDLAYERHTEIVGVQRKQAEIQEKQIEIQNQQTSFVLIMALATMILAIGSIAQLWVSFFINVPNLYEISFFLTILTFVVVVGYTGVMTYLYLIISKIFKKNKFLY